MGLDMYLQGERFRKSNNRTTLEDFPLRKEVLEIGYWRKHPDLHGYIVKEFAEGKDDCEPIELYADDCRKILKAIASDKLPHTEGFFFGRSFKKGDPDETYGNKTFSYERQKKEDQEIFTRAIVWLEKKVDGVWKSISYEASW